MKEIDPKVLTGNSKWLFNKIEFDDEEHLYAEIRKHPFGLVLRYAAGLFVTVLFSFIFFIAPLLIGETLSGINQEGLKGLMTLIGFVLVILVLVVTVISAYLYESNVLLVTSDKLAQVLNQSIFSRKISQLSIGAVQDVTVVQNGVFPSLFNYGTITIETAGEQSNLIFTFTPDPYNKSKAIVASHEENLKKYGN
jgi:uncharacterized membrane protein YdbT with pleckstrin-like domain